MPTLSAGIYVKEFDFSQYAPALSLTTLAVVGGASRGPLNKPSSPIADEATLVATYGKPLLNDFGLQAAIQYLKQGSSLIYVRVAHAADVATASYPVAGLSGGTAAVPATGTLAFLLSANPANHEKVTIRQTIPQAKLQNNSLGALGNQTITKTGTAALVTGMTGGTTSQFATGTIAFAASSQPVSGDTIVISDGTTTKTFQFVAATGGNIVVALGADAYGTLANLITAINTAGFNVAASNNTVAVTFEFTSDGTWTPGNTPIAIGASGAVTMASLINTIALSVLQVIVVNTVAAVPTCTITQKTAYAGAVGNATITVSGSVASATGLTGGVDAVPGSNVTVAGVYANTPGSWGNSIQVVIQASQTMGAPAGNFDFQVYYPIDSTGTLALVEQYNNLSLDPASKRYADTALAHGLPNEASASQYCAWQTLVPGGQAVGPQTLALGVLPGTVGNDGIDNLSTADYIGTVNGQTASGMASLYNSETVEFNVLAVPGISDAAVITAATTLVETRGDSIYIVDPPLGLSLAQVIDWHNGVSLIVPNAPTTALTSSYGALYWSWVKIYDSYNAVEIFMPPSGFVAAVYAYTDNNGGPWLAPAGVVRGKVIGDMVEYSPSQAERALLNAGQNRVNPIVDFLSNGLTVYGNRTLQRTPTSLDSVHVRRMLLYAEKLCATAVAVLVFDPNDPITWARFVSLVNPILANIQAGRGLTTFQVICDKTTNPPNQISNKTMKAKLLMQPIDAAEILEIDFALFAAGATFSSAF